MIQDIFIIGATGRVGKTLISQIFEKQDTNETLHENPTRIIGLASKSSYIYDREGIDYHRAIEFSERKLKNGEKNSSIDDILSKVESQKNKDKRDNKRLAFVDATDSQLLNDFHKRVIELTNYSIVTANKNPLINCDYDSFQDLTRETQRYGYRCCVMAGANTINDIRDLRDLGDSPTEISGCLSGTLSFLTTELEKGRRLSEIVTEAMELGYTESNPTIDLSGKDVARKIVILSRTAGYNIREDHVEVIPFIPEHYLSEQNNSQFVRNLQDLDSGFRRDTEKAQSKGNVLRYIAALSFRDKRPCINVGLKEVSKNSEFGSLQGRRNKILIKTKTYDKDFSSIEVPGAGLEVTAQNIRWDLLYQVQHRDLAGER